MEMYQPHLLDEVRHGWQLHKDGFIRDIYFRQDRPGVVIVAECASIDAARVILGEFPLAKAGLIDWNIVPLGPFLNWELLFAPHNI
jgi:hypothetical protein